MLIKRLLKIYNYSFIFLSIFIIYNSLFVRSAEAVCPVCTVAVGAGLGVSRALGIDDAVTSVWIGGLIISSSFWFLDWLKRKKPEFPITKIQFSVFLLMNLLFILPLWFGKYIGRLNNSIFGVDKILFGIFWGSLAFMAGKWADGKVREKRGEQMFMYQKVVFPVAGLIITSVILHFLVS